MSRPENRKQWRRSPAGATASARLLRWPARNYFAELEPSLNDGHPVDDLMARDPDLRRIRHRAHRHLARLQGTTDSSAVLDFEAARNHLDAARIETAYNIGDEGGLVAGTVAGFVGASGVGREASEVALLRDIRRTVAAAAVPRGRVQASCSSWRWHWHSSRSRPRREGRCRVEQYVPVTGTVRPETTGTRTARRLRSGSGGPRPSITTTEGARPP